jgi:hypothetical protein
MDVIGDLVTRERRSDDVAIRVASRAGSYSYEKACTSAWKAGNLLTHYGVRRGATVGVDAGERPSPPPILAAVGTTLLGATVRLAPNADADAQALVVPADHVSSYRPKSGTKVLGYGDVPERSGIAHFEREAWSENPVEPPESVAPEAVALTDGSSTWSHASLLDAAQRVVGEYGLDAADDVALRTHLDNPAVFVAGVLAPLAAGATILLDSNQQGTVAVTAGEDDIPEDSEVDIDDVL